jgi:hypothetical protein
MKNKNIRWSFFWAGGMRWVAALCLLATAATVVAEQFGDFTYVINGDGTITITKQTGFSGPVTIPSAIANKAVVSIGVQAFASCTNLTGVTIPE